MKFRIWNPNLQQFVSGDEWYIHPDGRVMFYDVLEGKLVESKCVANKICEGIQDSAGEPIYYGDCIKTIQYLDGKEYIKHYFVDSFNHEEQLRRELSNGYDITVVGNFFEDFHKIVY